MSHESREEVRRLQEMDRRLVASRTHAHAYEGSPSLPFPPIREEGWFEVSFKQSQEARDRAREIGEATQSGELGGLDVWHYRDEMLSTGTHRFFRFQTPVGSSIGALRYVGQAGELGAPTAPAGATVVDPTVAENACTGWAANASNSDMDTYAQQINDAGPSEGDRTYLWYERALYRFTSGTGVTMPGIMGTRVDKCGGLPANWTPPATPNTPPPGTKTSSGLTGTQIALIVLGVATAAAGGAYVLSH